VHQYAPTRAATKARASYNHLLSSQGHGDTLRTIDRDLRLLALANVLYAIGLGLYLQLLFVYALQLGASRFTIGVLNAILIGTITLVNLPGAWAATRFRIKRVLVVVWWLLVPTAILFYLAPSWQWLIPGLILFGITYANNPAFKAYIYLKSEPSSVGASMAFVFASYSLGLVGAPLLGGWIADHAGMRTVFLISTGVYAASATVVCFLGDTPHHPAAGSWRATDLLRNRLFRGHVGFFFVGFLAVYVAMPFINPYLAQVHRQGYTALGVYSSLVALGSVVAVQLSGRLTDRWGPRAGVASVLSLMLLGCAVLLAGTGPGMWAAAMVCCGAFDTFRYVPTMILAESFGSMPLPWGYAIFDTVTGLPMVCGAALGGLLYKTSYGLPFKFAIVVAACLLVLTALKGPATGRDVVQQPD
jgi:MFS transporter, DHA1 family, tetracycline resistance protein